MKQPTKDALREQLALAATQLIHERITHAMRIRLMELRLRPRKPWWRRWFA